MSALMNTDDNLQDDRIHYGRIYGLFYTLGTTILGSNRYHCHQTPIQSLVTKFYPVRIASADTPAYETTLFRVFPNSSVSYVHHSGPYPTI